MTKTVDSFKNRWVLKADEIKKQEFDNTQCYWIKRCFIEEFTTFAENSVNRESAFIQLHEISNDLDIALTIAYSNYRKNRHRFLFESLSKLFNGKKDFNL